MQTDLCTAKVIADSINEAGHRLTTVQLRYPRIVHAELMTHRVFSRNASSSRAVPVKKMLEQVRTDPAMPARFGKNQAGMQDAGEHDGKVVLPRHLYGSFSKFQGRRYEVNSDSDIVVEPEHYWRFCGWMAASQAEAMMEAGYHKQVCNRLLEPFQFISVVVTATEWENWTKLRLHEAADPTMYALAKAIDDARTESTPMQLIAGQWHLPYVRKAEASLSLEDRLVFSVARCARVSYLNHDGTEPNHEADRKLYERLVGSDPKHMSPTEHQALSQQVEGLESNLVGWTQYRKFIEIGAEIRQVA